eukprot:366142-Chlamydomonas_euryale.AAC.5
MPVEQQARRITCASSNMPVQQQARRATCPSCNMPVVQHARRPRDIARPVCFQNGATAGHRIVGHSSLLNTIGTVGPHLTSPTPTSHPPACRAARSRAWRQRATRRCRWRRSKSACGSLARRQTWRAPRRPPTFRATA